MALSIDEVLQKNDTFCIEVDVPEWDGKVKLVPCMSSDWDAHEFQIALAREDIDKVKGVKARLVAACWADDDGNRVKWSPTAIASLAAKSPRVINRLYDECEKLCKDIGPAEKN